MRQPWSPPWRTTTTCGRSLAIGGTEWSVRQIQPNLVVLFSLALIAAGEAVYRSVLVRRVARSAIDGRQRSDVCSDRVGRQTLIGPRSCGPSNVSAITDILQIGVIGIVHGCLFAGV